MKGALAYVRVHRKMPWLRQGMHMEMNGKHGVVTGGNSFCNIQVRFDGRSYSSNVHPHWETVYFDTDGNVVADYRKEKGTNE